MPERSGSFWTRFWRDEFGSVSVIDILLMGVIVGIGGLVGLATFRDHVVWHFGDAAAALSNLNQSYSVVIGATTIVYTDPGIPTTNCTAIVDASQE